MGAGTSNGLPERVEFYFDPLCPWAYQTSLWIREVRIRTGLDITWSFFSLEEINLKPGKRHPWEREWSFGWGPMRVGAYLRRESMDLLDRWYLAAGRALHERGEKLHRREIAERVAEEAGLPEGAVAAALADETTHDDVRADHERAVGGHGIFGVPTLVFPSGSALFGPTVAPAPTGDEALDLWRLTAAWAGFPYLYEMKRPKNGDDQRHIAEVFTPYLAARDWETVERPAP